MLPLHILPSFGCTWGSLDKSSSHEIQLGDMKAKFLGGTWLAQWVEHMTVDLGVMSLSPKLGVEII